MSMKRDMIIAPLHHSAIHGLHTQNPSLGDTVRLLERWVAGHMFSGMKILFFVLCLMFVKFSGHLEHETLELVVASIYLDTQSSKPQSATSAFLRCLNR
jgi:hypothetical protein